MSEAMAGVPAMDFVAKPPRDSSVVIVFRRTPTGVETFWLKREQKLKFAGGFYAFPGGRLDKTDAQVPVEGATGNEAALIVAAARELFEEAGLLVAAPNATDLDALRKGLLDQTMTFAEVLAKTGGVMRASDYVPAGRWITPGFMPVRFDTRFYLVEAPPKQKAEVWPGELSYGAWVKPDEALKEWDAGTALLHPPNRHAMQGLRLFDQGKSFADVQTFLANPPYCVDHVSLRLDFQAGVMFIPLKTPTLPPATHTNAYVLGTGELLIVDPGSPDDDEVDILIARVKELTQEGRTPLALVATHHHGDHTGGLARAAKALGLPVWAHARTADRLPVKASRLLEDGEVLALKGPKPMRWRVLHTPGHARGHVCLYDEASKAAIVGDMVAGVGTIVIDPPEGEMGEYLKQLERLRDLPVTTLYPAHGPAIPDGPAKLDEYLMHRRWREEKVLQAVGELGEPTLQQVVEKAYDDVQSFVWPIAERNTVAILDKLLADHRVASKNDHWSVVKPG